MALPVTVSVPVEASIPTGASWLSITSVAAAYGGAECRDSDTGEFRLTLEVSIVAVELRLTRG